MSRPRKPHYPPTPPWWDGSWAELYAKADSQQFVPLDEGAARQWAIGLFQAMGEFGYLRPGGRQKEELAARVRSIRGGLDEYSGYDEIAYSIQQAERGDEAAKTILLETAALFLENGYPPKIWGPLKDFVAEFLRNPEPPKPKLGRNRESLAQRNTMISYAVAQIHQRWGFSPTRNAATRDKGRPSATSIVRDALLSACAGVSEDEIVKIWTASNKELDRWKKVGALSNTTTALGTAKSGIAIRFDLENAMPKTSDIVGQFHQLPDEAVINSPVVEFLTGLSSRSVRRHPALPRRYVSADRYGFAVGDVRRLLSGEAVPESARRVRYQLKRNAP